MAENPPSQHPEPETAPDPDEDDLSDLDDMLDEFSATNIKDKKPQQPPQAPPSSSANPQPPQPATEDDEFARQLQAGMADLLGQLGNDPDMQKQFEEMMKELSAAAQQDVESQPAPTETASKPAAESTASNPTSAPSSSAKAAPFLSTIEKTMERMQQSGDSASAAAATSSEQDMLAQMLKDLESGNFPGMEGDQTDFNTMLMGMMEQLVNKDILYEPMRELHDGFPDWLAKNKAEVKKDDLERYETQQKIVKDIVQRFETPGFSDENKEDRDYIVEKMQQMQAAGAPPPGLVGDMNAIQDSLGDMDSGCAQQ